MHHSVRVILYATLLILIAASVAVFFIPSHWLSLFDNLKWTISSGAATYFAWVGVRHANRNQREYRQWFLLGIASYFFGQIFWDFQIAFHRNPFPAISDLFYMLLGPCCLIGLLKALNANLDKAKKTAVILDISMITISVIAVTLSIYLSRELTGTLLQKVFLVTYPIGLLSAASVALLIHPFLRLKPSWPVAIFCIGLLIEGIIWMQWNVYTLKGQREAGSLLNHMFSVSDLLIGLGTMGWTIHISHHSRLNYVYHQIQRAIPLVAMIAGVVTIAMIFFETIVPIVRYIALCASLAIIVLAVIRQSLLLADSERLIEADKQVIETNQRYEYLANHDMLTGLPNRRLFEARLAQAIDSATTGKYALALVYIDIDRFKTVNDSLGHVIGDSLLVEIVKRLNARLKLEHTFSRFGGDEFAVIVEKVDDKSDVESIAQEVTDLLAKPFLINDTQEIIVGASLGISLFPTDAKDAVQLVRNADSAMYHAKENGRNHYEFYTSDLTVRANKRLLLESQLRQAIQKSQFVLHYQPVVEYSLSDNQTKVEAVEALIRWNRQPSELVMPNEFIRCAEDIGFILPIDRWVLSKACQQLAEWDAQGLSKINISVNISPNQFHDVTFLESLQLTLEKSGIAPERLTLEITEGAIMEQEEYAVETLRAIKAIGVRISIDDFGTGHSSLAKLKRLPLDELKVDRAFVGDIPKNKDDRLIASTIVAMAKALSLQVVVEGVETSEQLAFFAKAKCDRYQGYYFSKPVPPEDIPDLIKQLVTESQAFNLN
ncbi:MAG: putative bifunctional diguanylate cyclase/phosphodiesterase [Methylophilus sp.]